MLIHRRRRWMQDQGQARSDKCDGTVGEYKGVGVEGQRRDLESLKGAAAGQVVIGAVDDQSRDVPIETGSRHVGQQVAREDVLAAAALIAPEMQP